MRIGPCDEQLQWSSRLHAAQGQMLTADNTVCMIVFSNVTIDTGDVFSEKVWLCRDLCERRPVEGYVCALQRKSMIASCCVAGVLLT